MAEKSRLLLWYFLQMMASVFFLFFLTVGLAKPSADLVIYMNDKNVTKSITEWVVFGITAPIATAIWCMLWVWFKRSEKQCIELLGK